VIPVKKCNCTPNGPQATPYVALAPGAVRGYPRGGAAPITFVSMPEAQPAEAILPAAPEPVRARSGCGCRGGVLIA